jgi:tetratricopeptide (TPR) repeat protein
MPKNPEIFYYRGLCRLWKGDIRLAQEDIFQAVELNPDFIDARVMLAKTYLQDSREGNLRLAQVQLDEALKQIPNHLEALTLLGSLKIRAQNLEGAKKVFEKVIEIYPDHAPAYIELGFIYVRTNRQKDAIALFKKTLEVDPLQATALKVIVDDYLKHKDFDSALKLCEENKKKAKDNQVHAAVIEYLKGRIYKFKGDIERAQTHFETSIELDSDLINAHMALTEMYIKEKNIDRVISHYENILNRNPDFLLGYMTLGFIYDQRGQKEKAEDFYRKALEVKSDFAPAANNLAWILAKDSNKIDEAFRLAKIAKESMPDDPNVLDTLGWTYYLMGYFGMATTILEDSVSKMPNNTLSNYHLGKAYYKYEDYGNAKKYLEKALHIDPNFSDAEDARHILEEIIAIGTNSTQ